MPRMFLPLAAVAVLLSACGDKKSDDLAAGVSAAGDTVRSMTGDSVSAVEVIPPAATPPTTAAEPLVAGRESPAPVASRPRPATRPTTRPAAPRPTPSSSGSTPSSASSSSSGTVAAGTTISVTNGPKVCSNTLTVGDRVTTTTNNAISASNGVSIPAGARMGLVVTKSKTSGSQGDDAALEFDVRSLTFGDETYTVAGTVSTDAVVMERKGGDGKKVAIGAAAGAVIGNVIGGGSRAQRTVVGAAAGGLAGAAAAAMTGDRLACLPENAALTVRLGSALTVKN
ncbi:MAG: hypothetical protein V4813_09560 [Gemmatimonadota bacterium]